MEIKDLIVIFDDFISEECCDEMVDWFTSNQDLHKNGSITGPIDDGFYDNHVRLDFKKAIQSNPPLDHEISHIITSIIRDCYIEYGKIRPVPETNQICFRDYSIRVYNENDGYFNCHIDQGPGGTVSRLFAILMYLNTVDEGGETEFPTYDIKVKPKKGRVLIFPCNYIFPHQGNTPLSEDKYLATAFINYIDV